MMFYCKNAKYEKQRRPFSDPTLWVFLRKRAAVSPRQHQLGVVTRDSGGL